MAQLQSTEEIIVKFELFAGDETELSSQEEVDLLQKIYEQVQSEEEWEILKKTGTGTLSTSVDYIDFSTAVTDFARFTSKPILYLFALGSTTSYDEYHIVPYEDRRQYLGQDGYAYYDARQGRLIFTKQPTQARTWELDYIYSPTVLDTVSSNPVFPKKYWDVFYHGMLVDNDIIQMSEKARSYQKENGGRYTDILNQMKAWNKGLNSYDTYGV